jgi:ferredoxin
MKPLRYLSNVTTLKFDPVRCTGCGMCAQVCPHGVWSVSRRAAIIDRDACMECGACARNCAAGAIQVQAGVGCANGILRGMLNGTSPDCCCG